MKVKMSCSPAVCYIVLFILLDVAVKSQMSSNSNSHGFMQESDVRYIVESIPISVHKEFTASPSAKVSKGDESSSGLSSKGYLRFEPPLLDFKDRHLGVPHKAKVTIINQNGNKTIHMSSISGTTVHFHSSFFENKIIPPLGNTSFNVVFLGREEGETESNLFIHTSEGSFKYQVRGSSIQSPYRLRPVSGVRLPLNASFSPVIQMHNPYSTPLQLVEVFSSGGEFHLELPSGELEGPKHLWEIPAFLTKPIIRVRFHARAQKNHTAYIRLKVNNSDEVLVVPLEVEVGASCGLYYHEDVIDFGIGGSHDPPTTRKLLLHNSWKKPIKIQNVISTPVSKAFKIDFQPVKVPPESEEATEVAQLSFDWAAALEAGHTAGRIVVKSKQGTHKLVIPYTATVLEGGLAYDSQVTRFRSDSPNTPPRTFQMTNNFRIPIAITNVSLSKDAQPYFEVSKFEGHILQPKESVVLFQISPTTPKLPLLDASIVITTNVSVITVPLLCYNGKLTKVISQGNESELELGTVGSGTEKQIVFALVNENPVPVTLLSWDTSLPSCSVVIDSIQKDNTHTCLHHHCVYNETTEERSVGPGEFVVVRLHLQAGSQVGDIQAHVTLRTQYEIIQIGAHMRVEHGSLQVTPDPVRFRDCFPGKVCSEDLRVQSLFSMTMAVTGVVAVPMDPRLTFSPAAPPALLLAPAATTPLGTLSFDTRLLPPEYNYLAVTHNFTGAGRWQDTLELPVHCLQNDLRLLRARYDQYRNLSSHLFNLTLRVDTTEVKDHVFGAQVGLSWPRLAADVVFPLTQVGNKTHRSLVITNPGTHQPLMVQLVLGSAYPSAAALLDILPHRLRPDSIEDSESGTGEFMVDVTGSLHQVTGPHIHRDTWAFLLPPSANVTVGVYFTPTAARMTSTILLLRNNLTVIEALQLSGTGAFTQFKFGNRKPGSSTPLLFELADKHLKDCEREKQRKFLTPNLTVKRSFTARNTGSLPVSVHGFDISGLSCEGYGFRVLNCEAFQLAPNSTRKVDIAFSPDFTLARVQRTLGVWTSDSVANYTLVATLPPFLLGTCSSVLARPAWEPLLYYCAVTFMVFLLVCVLSAAFLESNRALKCALIAMSRENATTQPVLDLKSIGTGVGLGSVSGMTYSAEKGDTGSSVSWTRPPPPSPSPSPSPSPISETEVVKEKLLKTEAEEVAGVFINPNTKCSKKKERDKTAVVKRLSDVTDGERRSSWAADYTVERKTTPPAVKSPPKPTTPVPPPEQSKPENKRKLSKKNSNSGRIVREVASGLPVASLCSSANDDTETSSTTTESSHDDGDKEVEGLREGIVECGLKQQGRSGRGLRGGGGEPGKSPPPPTYCTTGSASSLEHEWEDEEPTHALVTKKAAARTRKSTSKTGKSGESNQSGQNSSRSKNGNVTKPTSSRAKEKQALTQKRSIEKVLSQPKPVIYEPPPPPLRVWDESRASFSDVVARSDPAKHSLDQPSCQHPVSSQTPSQPVVSSTPSSPALLGPIGSKKVFPSVWDHWSDAADLGPAPTTPTATTNIPAPTPPSSSFFFDTRPTPPLQSTSYDNSWTESNMILKILQAEEQQRRVEAESFHHRPMFHDTWNPWEPICSGTTEPTPAPAHTPTPSLWGSDVWAPTPSPAPSNWVTSHRPPPGLQEPEPEPIALDYDPFRSLSNIWAPHTPNNFWKPPHSKNN